MKQVIIAILGSENSGRIEIMKYLSDKIGKGCKIVKLDNNCQDVIKNLRNNKQPVSILWNINSLSEIKLLKNLGVHIWRLTKNTDYSSDIYKYDAWDLVLDNDEMKPESMNKWCYDEYRHISPFEESPYK